MNSDIKNLTQQLNQHIKMTDWTHYLLKPENLTQDFPLNSLSSALGRILEANIYIVAYDGTIHGYYETHKINTGRVYDIVQRKQFPLNYLKRINAIDDTEENLSIYDNRTIFPVETKSLYEQALTTLVPVEMSKKRRGTILVATIDQELSPSEVGLVEYAANIVGIAFSFKESVEQVTEQNKREKAHLAYNTTTKTERKALRGLYEVLGNKQEMRVTTSEIADQLGITRSIIVNSLQKLVVAGVIEQKSMGMKGTHIKLVNDYFRDILFQDEE